MSPQKKGDVKSESWLDLRTCAAKELFECTQASEALKAGANDEKSINEERRKTNKVVQRCNKSTAALQQQQQKQPSGNKNSVWRHSSLEPRELLNARLNSIDRKKTAANFNETTRYEQQQHKANQTRNALRTSFSNLSCKFNARIDKLRNSCKKLMQNYQSNATATTNSIEKIDANSLRRVNSFVATKESLKFVDNKLFGFSSTSSSSLSLSCQQMIEEASKSRSAKQQRQLRFEQQSRMRPQSLSIEQPSQNSTNYSQQQRRALQSTTTLVVSQSIQSLQQQAASGEFKTQSTQAVLASPQLCVSSPRFARCASEVAPQRWQQDSNRNRRLRFSNARLYANSTPACAAAVSSSLDSSSSNSTLVLNAARDNSDDDDEEEEDAASLSDARHSDAAACAPKATVSDTDSNDDDDDDCCSAKDVGASRETTNATVAAAWAPARQSSLTPPPQHQQQQQQQQYKQQSLEQPLALLSPQQAKQATTSSSSSSSSASYTYYSNLSSASLRLSVDDTLSLRSTANNEISGDRNTNNYSILDDTHNCSKAAIKDATNNDDDGVFTKCHKAKKLQRRKRRGKIIIVDDKKKLANLSENDADCENDASSNCKVSQSIVDSNKQSPDHKQSKAVAAADSVTKTSSNNQNINKQTSFNLSKTSKAASQMFVATQQPKKQLATGNNGEQQQQCVDVKIAASAVSHLQHPSTLASNEYFFHIPQPTLPSMPVASNALAFCRLHQQVLPVTQQLDGSTNNYNSQFFETSTAATAEQPAKLYVDEYVVAPINNQQQLQQQFNNNCNGTNDDYEDYAVPSDEDFLLERSQVELVQMIGEGQRGFVFLGKLQSRDGLQTTNVAVKTLKYETESNLNRLMCEAALMRQLDHPHIIKFYGVCNETPALIAMEIAAYGEARQYLRENKLFVGVAQLCLFVFQLSTALSYIESKRLVHRDVAARNVLVSSPDCVKLADFGLSRSLVAENQCFPSLVNNTQQQTTPTTADAGDAANNKQRALEKARSKGVIVDDNEPCYAAPRSKLPVRWLAPESLAFRLFTSASDVWMFAVCSWELFNYGELRPWAEIRNSQVLRYLQDGMRLARPLACPQRLYALMLRCWSVAPSKRPQFKYLKHDLWSIYLNERAIVEQTNIASLRRKSGLKFAQIEPSNVTPPPPHAPIALSRSSNNFLQINSRPPSQLLLQQQQQSRQLSKANFVNSEVLVNGSLARSNDFMSNVSSSSPCSSNGSSLAMSGRRSGCDGVGQRARLQQQASFNGEQTFVHVARNPSSPDCRMMLDEHKTTPDEITKKAQAARFERRMNGGRTLRKQRSQGTIQDVDTVQQLYNNCASSGLDYAPQQQQTFFAADAANQATVDNQAARQSMRFNPGSDDRRKAKRFMLRRPLSVEYPTFNELSAARLYAQDSHNVRLKNYNRFEANDEDNDGDNDDDDYNDEYNEQESDVENIDYAFKTSSAEMRRSKRRVKHEPHLVFKESPLAFDQQQQQQCNKQSDLFLVQHQQQEANDLYQGLAEIAMIKSPHDSSNERSRQQFNCLPRKVNAAAALAPSPCVNPIAHQTTQNMYTNPNSTTSVISTHKQPQVSSPKQHRDKQQHTHYNEHKQPATSKTNKLAAMFQSALRVSPTSLRASRVVASTTHDEEQRQEPRHKQERQSNNASTQDNFAQQRYEFNSSTPYTNQDMNNRRVDHQPQQAPGRVCQKHNQSAAAAQAEIDSSSKIETEKAAEADKKRQQQLALHQRLLGRIRPTSTVTPNAHQKKVLTSQASQPNRHIPTVDQSLQLLNSLMTDNNWKHDTSSAHLRNFLNRNSNINDSNGSQQQNSRLSRATSLFVDRLGE